MEEQFNYTFLPWLRQGFAKRIEAKDTLGASDGTGTERVSLKVELTVQGDNRTGGGVLTETLDHQVLVAGPGDVLGIDPKVILRAEPKNGIPNFEANFLAYLEFYEEDFPWRYTPTMPDTPSPHRLRPWLTLIVLKNDEFRIASSRNSTLIAIEPEKATDVFPDHRETWAWAHVQLARKMDNNTELSSKVQTMLRDHPDLGIARLLCPRRLQPNTEYTACLIPAFETGRLAGLGESTANVPAQMPSWKTGQMPHSEVRPFEYPVYFHWQFNTANGGDFESLVRKIRPFKLPEDKPTSLAMDIHDPGLGLQLPATTAEGVLQFESVLKASGFTTQPFPKSEPQTVYQKKLEQLLHLQNQADPLVLPPMYGAGQAGVQTLTETPPVPLPWLRPLNLDPRYRAMAGLGVRAIQEHQEELMEIAWQQIGEVEEANQRLREAQGIERAAKSILRKHFMPVKNTGTFIQLTAPILHRIVAEERVVAGKTIQQTVKGIFSENKQLESVISPAVHRAARFVHPTKTNIALDLNVFKLNNKPYKYDIGQMSEVLIPNTGGFVTQVNNKINLLKIKSAYLKVFDRTNLTTLDTNALSNQIDPTGLTTGQINSVKILIRHTVSFSVDAATGMRTVVLEPFVATSVVDENATLLRWGRVLAVKQGTAPFFNLPSTAMVSDWETYSSGYADFETLLGSGIIFSTIPANLFESKIWESVMPANAYARKIAATVRVVQTNRFSTNSGVRGIEDQPTTSPGLNLIMAHPIFDLPTYEYLTEQSKSYIFPLLDDMPTNTVGVFEVNRSVIEAYLAGMNTEMGRELLWREYPTDQRGSYFRRFWDPANPTLAAEPDVQFLHEWKAALGENHVRPGAPMALVIRGELLKKYPQTLVYAHKAKYTSTGNPRTLESNDPQNIEFPVFSAFIEPDIMLLGFNLSEAQVIGTRDSDPSIGRIRPNPGYFFVFRERPGQMQFGMDELEPDQTAGPLGSWNELSWQHLQSPEDIASYQINFEKPLSLVNPTGQARWGSNAAEMAAILLQKPVLMARHAQELLITDHSDLNF